MIEDFLFLGKLKALLQKSILKGLVNNEWTFIFITLFYMKAMQASCVSFLSLSFLSVHLPPNHYRECYQTELSLKAAAELHNYRQMWYKPESWRGERV